MNATTAVIDYGAGNLRSVTTALRHLGSDFRIVDQGKDLGTFPRMIFPGVGEAASVCKYLQERTLDRAIGDFYREGKPILGICIGAHVVLEYSEESNAPCLGLVGGEVQYLRGRNKVPHIGWDAVYIRREDPLFRNIPDGSSFYFVHSYYPVMSNEEHVVAESEYGQRFCSVWRCNNMVATQFHPEKSAVWGLRLLQNWLEKS